MIKGGRAMANMLEKYAADREMTIAAIIHEWV